MPEFASRIKFALVLCAIAVLALLAGTAGAERIQKGNLIASLNGGISPMTLPRDRAIPVSVYLEGGIDTVDRSPLPRVNRLKLEIGWRGDLLTKGLPVYPWASLKGLTTWLALEQCGASLVGRDKLHA